MVTVVSNYYPDKDFGFVHCHLYLRDMTLNQSHETSLGHEQFCEILSRSNLAKMSNDPETDVYTVTLTAEIWS